MADPDHAATAPGAADKPAEPGTAEAGARSGALSCLLLPTFSEACKLVGSAYSCLVVRTHRRALALSPRYLHKKRSGIQEQLSSELLKYSAKLEGVPVAYDNVKIVGEFGDIQDDVGYIHLTVQADFVIFQPKRGEKLVGVVNKFAPSHIGCLVHGCFNASIPRPFKMPIEAWQHVGVKVGDRIEFEVFRLDSDAMGVFCIRARMDREMEANAIERLNEAIKAQTSEVSSDTGKAAEDGADTEPKEIPEETPKKKAKKRAFKETILQEVSGSTEGLGEINTTLEVIPKKKSKKKKHQEINSETDFAEVNTSVENITVEDSAMNSLSQSDDIIPKKVRKKKSKHNDSLLSGGDSDNSIRVEESGILGLDNESLVLSNQEQPKKSKKKKHKDNSDRDMNESLQNGITEESSFTEVLGAEDGTVLENLKKKRTKKRTQSFTTEDSILESTNGGADFMSQESLVDDLMIQHETPKQKKHKKNKTLC